MWLKEIKYRPFNFAIGVLGVMAAVAVIVLFFMMTAASQNETRILTRNMGFNLKIIPKTTNMTHFWNTGYSDKTMPDNYAQIISEANDFIYAHVTATLHKRINWRQQEVLLTGLSPDELEPVHKKANHSKMIFAVPKKKVYVGYELAHQLNLKEGDKIELFGKQFQIEQTLIESGSIDDIRIYFDLEELQSLLKMSGKINEIMALNCVCCMKGDDPLKELRTHLEEILPDAKIIMNRTIAIAREQQRKMIDNYFALLLPFILIVCAIWVGFFSLLNVIQRRTEIALITSLGFNKWKIAKLFIFRSLLIGFVGGLIGYFLATWIGLTYGPQIFKVTAHAIHPLYSLLVASLIIAPFFAILSSTIPILFAISQEPAEVLKQG